MKIGLSHEEAKTIKRIADLADLSVLINEKNILEVPNALVGLNEAESMLRIVPKHMRRKFVEKNMKWFRLLGLK